MSAKRRIIPVFIPHMGCPNDCVFCNQRRISGIKLPPGAETVRQAIGIAEGDHPAELAFYGGSFTAIPERTQTELLRAAQPFLQQHLGNEIRVSTRPDGIDEQSVERLIRYGVKTVELGAQSMCGDVLNMTKRGHTVEDVESAARLIKKAGLKLILQMMTGLPGDTPEKSLYTAKRFASLNPDGVRIYPTVVVRDTELYDMWRRGEYLEHTVDDAVTLCAELVPLFENAGITIIRLGLNPTDELSGGAAVAGAYHPAFGELVYSRVYLNKAISLLTGVETGGDVTLGVAKGRVSMMIGQKRHNIGLLEQWFSLRSVRVVEVDAAPGEIRIIKR